MRNKMKNKQLSWGIFLVVVSAVALFAAPTSLGGPASYVIVDGPSMQPTYNNGDLVFAYEKDRYDIGDTIVYDAPVDTQFNVIHRITAVTEGGYITQGDNRNEVDGWIAPEGQIYGSALFHIPNGGAAIAFLRQPAVVVALLAGWLMFEVMKRRETRQAQDVAEGVS
jgi:signal peptidase I